jgi:hypothetical protein
LSYFIIGARILERGVERISLLKMGGYQLLNRFLFGGYFF